jgi:DNA (cytosine-5)-methyltransferase 1
MRQTMDKPTYCVPSMQEIREIPWNGLTVASTFSGCGGSCTGYRMAGYRVVWANEFVPAAQESYRANMSPHCCLDPRDIKSIQPGEVLKVTGLQKGELDLLDGSPPCQAFSTAGQREKGWGKAKTYEHGAKQCNETLFDEYIRLLRGLMPRTFVAENVSGLVKGTAKGYFLEILAALKASGYRVKCKVLDAQWLGVPQCRQRTIFVGVREDLNLEPVHPKPLLYQYSVRDALPWIDKALHDTGGNNPARWAANVDIMNRSSPTITNGIGGMNSCHFKVVPLPPSRLKSGAYGVQDVHPDRPCPTVTIASPGNDLSVLVEDNRTCRTVTSDDSFGSRGVVKRKFIIAEVRRLCAFPDDFILCGSYTQQWERLGNAVPPVMMRAIAETIRDQILIPDRSDAR